MSKKTKIIIIGVFCVLFLLASVAYAVCFNDSRLVEPMDFDSYVFQIKDLPMILSVAVVNLYVFAIAGMMIVKILKERKCPVKTTRKLNPKLGILGFLGFMGFLGFPAFREAGDVSAFVFFTFFGFFGFYYEGKMAGTFMDERFRENAARAQLMALKTTCGIIFFALILFAGSGGRLVGSLEYAMIGLIIIISLAMGLGTFLSEYLLYRYDHDDQLDEE